MKTTSKLSGVIFASRAASTGSRASNSIGESTFGSDSVLPLMDAKTGPIESVNLGKRQVGSAGVGSAGVGSGGVGSGEVGSEHWGVASGD